MNDVDNDNDEEGVYIEFVTFECTLCGAKTTIGVSEQSLEKGVELECSGCGEKGKVRYADHGEVI